MPIVNPTLPADGDDAVVEPYNSAILAILSVMNGNLDSDNIAAGSIGLAQLSTTLQGYLVPVATITAFGGSTAPTGWLLCDGSSVLRASYSALFAALGTNYGSVDGTHFTLPDLRGRTPVGADAMGGTAANRIQRSTTLSTTSGSPTATVASATGLSRGMYITNVNVPAGTTISSISGTTITMSANASATGATVAARFSMLGNDSQVLGAAGGADVHQLVIDQLAAHTHQYNASNLSAGVAAAGASIGFAGAPSGSTGGDQAHPNMQPSQVTNFIIKT